MRRRARSMAKQCLTFHFLWPVNRHNSSGSSASHRLRGALAERRGGRGGEGSAAFFIRLVIVMCAIPVSRTMLRCELRSLNRSSTYA